MSNVLTKMEIVLYMPSLQPLGPSASFVCRQNRLPQLISVVYGKASTSSHKGLIEWNTQVRWFLYLPRNRKYVMHPEPRAQGSMENRIFKEKAPSSLFPHKNGRFQTSTPEMYSDPPASVVYLTQGAANTGELHSDNEPWVGSFFPPRVRFKLAVSSDREEKGMSFFSHAASLQTIQWSFNQHAQVFKSKSILNLLKRSEAYSLIHVCSFWAVSSPSLEKHVRGGPRMDCDLSCREVKCRD